MEGHWERGNAPLRTLTGRERRAFRATAVLLAVTAAAVLGWALLRGGTAASGPGCVDAFVGSTMGGARVHACGDEALRLCRGTPTARQPSFARQCAALDRVAKAGAAGSARVRTR